jgi:hypothetical protein
MTLIPAITTFTATTQAKAAEVNANFAAIRNTLNSYGLFTDVDRTITAALTFTPTVGVGITVTTGGITITAGGLTVSAGGINVTGNSTITGTLTVTSTLTANGASVVSGSGTTGKLARFTAASAIGDSGLTDNGTYTTNATQARARATKGSQALSTGVNLLSMSAAAINVGTMWAIGNPTRFTVPAAADGIYLLVLTCHCVHASASSLITPGFRKNGATDIQGGSAVVGTQSQVLTFPVIEQLAAGDYVEPTMASGDNAQTASGIIVSVIKLW